MAVTCPRCLRQYDITLFEFGRKVQCECGYYLTGAQRRELPEPHRDGEDREGGDSS